MKETINKHSDTQHLLAVVQQDYAEETKNRLEKQFVLLVGNKTIVKNEYYKRKRDLMS